MRIHIFIDVKRLTLALLLLALPFLLASAPVITGVQRLPAGDSTYPLRIGTWKYTPTVVVCSGAPVTVKAVKQAVGWWKLHGHQFFQAVTTDDSLDKCQAEYPEGFIVIHVGKQRMFTADDDLAETHFYIDEETQEISWAKIFLKSAPLERIMEHELGHALGFMHTMKVGHMMYPTWLRGGWDDRGLESTAPVVSRKQVQSIERRPHPIHRPIDSAPTEE